MGNSIIIQMLRAHITHYIKKSFKPEPNKKILSVVFSRCAMLALLIAVFFKMVKNIVKMH